MLPKSCFYLPSKWACHTFEQTWNPFTQRCFVSSLVEIFSFIIISPLTLHLNKLESPSPKDAVYQVWFILAQWCWRRILKVLMHHVTLIPSPFPRKENWKSLKTFEIIFFFNYSWHKVSLGSRNSKFLQMNVHSILKTVYYDF